MRALMCPFAITRIGVMANGVQPVKLGLISDIHGDPVALELAWAHLITMKVDRIVCAGDLVGYGPFPDRVVAFLKERQIPSVRGNHDRWAVSRAPGAVDEYGGGTPSHETLEYLGTLPADLLIEAGMRIGVVVHGSPSSDMEFVNRRTHPPAVLRGYLRCAWQRSTRGRPHAPANVVSQSGGRFGGQPRLGCLHAGGRLLAILRRGRPRHHGRDISPGRERRADPASPLGLNKPAQVRLANSAGLPLRSRRGHERRAE